MAFCYAGNAPRNGFSVFRDNKVHDYNFIIEKYRVANTRYQ